MNALPIEHPEVESALARVACAVVKDPVWQDEVLQSLRIWYHLFREKHPRFDTEALIRFAWHQGKSYAARRRPLMLCKRGQGKSQSLDHPVRRDYQEQVDPALALQHNPWPYREALDFYRSLRGIVSADALRVLALFHHGYTIREMVAMLGHSQGWIETRQRELRSAICILREAK